MRKVAGEVALPYCSTEAVGTFLMIIPEIQTL